MASFNPLLRQGRIVFTWMRDRNGHGKLRPAVIVTARPADAAEIVVMALTSTFPDPKPESHVPIPWHPKGHPATRLNKRTAAVVNWLGIIAHTDIVGFGGDVPSATLRIILEKLDDLS